MPNRRTPPAVPFLLAAALLLTSSCTGAPGGNAPSPTSAAGPASPTDRPTPTPSPEPGLALWLEGSEALPVTGTEAAAVARLAADAGLAFETRPLDPALELPLRTQVVVSLAPVDQLSALIARSPQARFIAAAADGSEPTPGVALLRADPELAARAGFAAGYAAALLAPNYRVAGVVSTQTSGAASIGPAFQNGARYYCGLCRPQTPPLADFPLLVTVEAYPDLAASERVADTLAASRVSFAYVAPDLTATSLPQALAARGIKLLAASRPDGLEDSAWVAAIRAAPDLAIEQAWQRLRDSSDPTTVMLPLVVADRNEAVLSAARLRLVEQVLLDLEQGFVATGG